MSSPLSRTDPSGLAESPLMVVRWLNQDGTQGGGCALSPAHAKALALAFHRFYPREVFWVEAPPAFAARGVVRARLPRPR